jgi:hypothetical protein
MQKLKIIKLKILLRSYIELMTLNKLYLYFSGYLYKIAQFNWLIPFFKYIVPVPKADNNGRYYLFVIIMALIYPSLWGIYFSLSRYIRMGSTLDVYQYLDILLQYCLDYLILSLFIIPYTFLCLAIFLYLVRSIRITLWYYTSLVLYAIHISMLQYYDYFHMFKLIYKAGFVYHDIISGSVGATTWDLKSTSRFRKIISYIYYRPYILNIIFISSLVLELLITHGTLYYGVYTIFIYPFIIGIFHCFHIVYCSKFIQDVCKSDYIAQNFANPRYYSKFWFYLPRAPQYFGFEYTYPPDLLNVIRKTCAFEERAYACSNRFKDDLSYRVWGRRHVSLKEKPYYKVVVTGYPKRWSMRIAAFYWQKKGIRWFHSSSVLYNPLPDKIHPLTIYFLKNNPYGILALLKHPGQNFGLIQKVSKNINWPSPSELYKDTSQTQIIVEPSSKTLTEVLEANFVIRFQSVVKKGVIIGTYKSMKELFGYPTDLMQMRPDFMSWWRNSIYGYKGYLGIDQKNKNVTNLGRNQVITNPEDSYNDIIDDFSEKLETKYELTPEMLHALSNLKKTSSDPDAHIQTWAENLHLFPEKWKPPLLLNKTFDDSHLKPEIVELIRQGEAEIQRISDELYTLNVSEETGSFDEKAIDHFSGSFLQELMR